MKFLKKLFGWDEPNIDDFARKLLDVLKAAGDTRTLHYDKENGQLRGEGSEVVNLANIFRDYAQLSRADRQDYLHRVAQTFVEAAQDDLPDSYEEAKQNLRPKIWSRSTIAMMELESRLHGDEAPDMPVYDVGDHLVSTLVYDLPHSMRSLSASDLEDWGVTYYQAMEDATANLEESTMAWAVAGDRLHCAATGDNYDSSRVLLFGRIQDMELDGAPIAVVPNRETFMVTGENDTVGLEMMLQLVDNPSEDTARPLCPLLLRLEDGVWESWMPPVHHTIYPSIREHETQFLGELYAQQKELLEQIFENEGIDIFVASFSAIRKQDDDESPVLSYCVWGDNVDSLLPRARTIIFADDDGVRASGLFADVQRVVGDLMQVDDTYYPARYRVKAFPTPAMLDEIGHDPDFE